MIILREGLLRNGEINSAPLMVILARQKFYYLLYINNDALIYLYFAELSSLYILATQKYFDVIIRSFDIIARIEYLYNDDILSTSVIKSCSRAIK